MEMLLLSLSFSFLVFLYYKSISIKSDIIFANNSSFFLVLYNTFVISLKM